MPTTHAPFVQPASARTNDALLAGDDFTDKPIPTASWTAWARSTFSYQGMYYISSGAPLFTHQYSHAWFDFRNKRDVFANYYQNSVTATIAHRLFRISLAGQFSDYSADLWGISSSDYRQPNGQTGYTAWGGPPALGPIDGTVVPGVAAGLLPFDFADTIEVLRWIRGHYAEARKQ